MANTFAFNDNYLATFPGPQSAYYNDSPYTLQSTTHAFGCIFQVPEDLTMTHANIVVGGKGGTIPNYKIQIWPMSTSVNNTPDTSGTVLAETADFQPTYSWPGTAMKVAFASSYAASAGDILCAIMVYGSGTCDSYNYAQINYCKGRQNGVSGAPSLITKTSSTWSNQTSFYPAGPIITTTRAMTLVVRHRLLEPP